jgi:hypothetical protein
MISTISYAGDNANQIPRSEVQQGAAIARAVIAPAKLNLAGKIPAQVFMGSYIVNSSGDCSGCHSFPQYLQPGNTAGSNPAAGDPFEGTPSTQSATGQLVANFNSSLFGRWTVFRTLYGTQPDA